MVYCILSLLALPSTLASNNQILLSLYTRVLRWKLCEMARFGRKQDPRGLHILVSKKGHSPGSPHHQLHQEEVVLINTAPPILGECVALLEIRLITRILISHSKMPCISQDTADIEDGPRPLHFLDCQYHDWHHPSLRTLFAVVELEIRPANIIGLLPACGYELDHMHTWIPSKSGK